MKIVINTNRFREVEIEENNDREIFVFNLEEKPIIDIDDQIILRSNNCNISFNYSLNDLLILRSKINKVIRNEPGKKTE